MPSLRVPSFSICSAAARATSARRWLALICWAAMIRPTPSTRNGSFGMPSMRAMANAATPAMASACRDWTSWLDACEPTSPSPEFERVTIMPVATAMSSAGTWVTSPSPTVRMEYVSTASMAGMPCMTTPITMPPSRLMSVMTMPAMASPLTNFDAPSIAP